MKASRTLGRLLLLFAALCLMILPISARTTVNPDADCSLTLTYAYGETAFEGLDISLHGIARFEKDGSLIPEEAHTDHLPDLNAIASQEEWNEVASTVSAYLVANPLPESAKGTTDAEGKVSFAGLKPGIYLVSGAQGDMEGGYCRFDAFCISIPGLDGEENWIYDVTANPKSVFHEVLPEPVEYTVIKLWKDTGFEEKRPEFVTVDLYKDRVFVESVRLDAENNWSYTWSAPDDGAVWTAVEQEVPEDYFVLVEQDGNVFKVTNVHDGGNPPPPQTGDSTQIYLIVIGCSVVGLVLVLVGFTGRKNKRK